MPGSQNFDLSHGGLSLLATIGGIILIDIVLSGDNALVIGAAASRLPRALRYLAILWGGAGAIILRIALAGVATLLLEVPLLQAAGGIVLMGIAIHLLLPQEGPRIQARERFWPAVATILIADATMSLDNIIAIGALAKGDLFVLALGLVVSMLVLFLASAVIARIIERLSVLLDLASLVLAYTAGNLVIADPLIGPHVAPFLKPLGVGPIPGAVALNVAFVVLVLIVDVGLRTGRIRRGRRHAGDVEAAPAVVADGLLGEYAQPDGEVFSGAMDGAGLELAAEDSFDSRPQDSRARDLVAREPVGSRPLGSGETSDGHSDEI